MNFFSKYRYALLWALFVLVLCGMNGNSVPKLTFSFTGIDKLAHFFLFGIQAWLILKPMQQNFKSLNLKGALVAVALSISYGILVEILQATVFINRSYDYADMLANSIGALLSLGVAVVRYR